jgi:hypothetical protein
MERLFLYRDSVSWVSSFLLPDLYCMDNVETHGLLLMFGLYDLHILDPPGFTRTDISA